MKVVVWDATFTLHQVQLGGCLGGCFLYEIPKYMYVSLVSFVLNGDSYK